MLPLLFLLMPLHGLRAGTYALLIGISDYREADLPNLLGSINDIALMTDYLKENYENPRITPLINEQATHGRITAELKHLQTVTEQDTVFIYYAGHGSRTPDLNGDEKSGGNDSSWITHGSRVPATSGIDNYDLIDDELAWYLNKIPTRKIILISDSCYAGSISRSGEPMAVRGADFDKRPHPMGKLHAAGFDGGIRLVATNDDQRAVEERVADKYYGFFTWNLVRALRLGARGETWRDIHQRTRALMNEKRLQNQEPQIEGNGDLKVDFSESVPTPSTAYVQGREDELWVLNVGLALGVGPGCRFERGRGIGKIELVVEEAYPFRAHARKLSGPDPDTSDPFRLTRFLIGQRKLRLAIRVDKEQDRHWAQWLEARIKAGFDDDIEIASAAEADRVLWVVRAESNSKAVFSLPQATEGGKAELWITDQREIPLVNGPLILLEGRKASDVADEFDADMLFILKRESLFRLDDELGKDAFLFTPIFCREGEPESDGLIRFAFAQKKKVYGQWLPAPGATLPTGTIMGYALKNLSDEERYFYVLNFGPDGEVRTVFPDKYIYDAGAAFDPHEERIILLKGARMMTRPGWEHYRVISSTRPLDRSVMRVRATTARGDDGQKYSDPLSRYLLGHRGDYNVEWSTSIVHFKVQDP